MQSERLRDHFMTFIGYPKDHSRLQLIVLRLCSFTDLPLIMTFT